MNRDIASGSIIAQGATKSSSPSLDLPDTTWDEGRLLDYMRRHDQAIGGLEHKTLQHEYCFGAAAQMKYEQLGGKWTRWAKDQGYPLETFRRRLLFVRAGSMEALDKYDGKMAAYYDLGIYRRPTQQELDTLDAEREAKAQADVTVAEPPVVVQDKNENAPTPDGDGAEAKPEGDGDETTLPDRLAVPTERPDAPTAAEILGRVVNLLVDAERVGLDDSCGALLDEIATIVGRLRGAQTGKGVAA